MRFRSGSSEVNVHSAFHVSRSFKVGRQVINRDALFCPKTSMYDSSQPHHCNTISVETTISRSLFCWSSLAFFISLTLCCPSVLYQHRVNIYLCFWCQTTSETQYFLRLFNQVFDCEIQWHDSKIWQVYFMSRWKLLLVDSVYMRSFVVADVRRADVFLWVVVGTLADCNSFAVFTVW